MKSLNNSQGFTLVELLIATTVFSVILLVAAAALIQVGRMYYKGVITSKTQNVARSVTDDVSRSIQFSSGNLTTASSGSNPLIQAICSGNTRFTYVVGAQVDNNAVSGTYNQDNRTMRHVLWQDEIGTEQCGNDLPNLLLDNPYAEAANSDRNGRELLENGMRLQTFSVQPQSGSSDSFNVDIGVIYYADKDLLDDFNNPTACKGSLVGGQWCAISNLNTVVYSRSK